MIQGSKRIEVCMGMGIEGISRIPREICGNGDRCCGNTTRMEMGAAGILRKWNLFLRELRRDALKILLTITILVR